jgi:hypothetical protein
MESKEKQRCRNVEVGKYEVPMSELPNFGLALDPLKILCHALATI